MVHWEQKNCPLAGKLGMIMAGMHVDGLGLVRVARGTWLVHLEVEYLAGLRMYLGIAWQA